MSTSDTLQDYDATIQKADKVIAELESKLTNVSVNIKPESVDIINAIKTLFGTSAINKDGSSTITFAMFRQVVDKIRQLGKVKVGDYI